MFKRKPTEKVIFPISAMIDCTFLLLIYFISVCSLHKQESDLLMQLPSLSSGLSSEIPDEQLIEVKPDNSVWINDMCITTNPMNDTALSGLLQKFNEICQAGKIPAMVTISANAACSHQTVISVLDACAIAGITNVTFTEDE